MTRDWTPRVAAVLCVFAACAARAQGQPAGAPATTPPDESAATAAGSTATLSPTLLRMAWLACRVRHPTTAYLLCDGRGYAEQPVSLSDSVKPTVAVR